MKVRVTKPLKTYDKPEVGKEYEVIDFYVTRFGRGIVYIEVNNQKVGLLVGEYEFV